MRVSRGKAANKRNKSDESKPVWRRNEGLILNAASWHTWARARARTWLNQVRTCVRACVRMNDAPHKVFKARRDNVRPSVLNIQSRSWRGRRDLDDSESARKTWEKRTALLTSCIRDPRDLQRPAAATWRPRLEQREPYSSRRVHAHARALLLR